MAAITAFRWSIPLLMALLVIIAALGFVRYFNAYEAPGEQWAPASPITHETARFTTNMGVAGDYRITVEKLSSKFPLLFVTYQPPGVVLQAMIHSDDGMVRLDQRFADEGNYRIEVQNLSRSDHHQRIDFTVQTPLYKYANDLLLFVLLLLAGWISGRRLRQLSAVTTALLLMVAGSPHHAAAHGGQHSAPSIEQQSTEDRLLSLRWQQEKPPSGYANRQPLDWSIQLQRSMGQPLDRVPFVLEIIHSESHMPVLSLSGVANHGLLPLYYSPPDGTDYQLQLQAVVDGKLHHLAMTATAAAIRPSMLRSWQSFGLMMIPLLMGMIWGWRTGR